MAISTSGQICWQAPSNIALVKYWGKYAEQFPSNPSISMTLSHSKTITGLRWREREGDTDEVEFDYFFAGERNPQFNKKIASFLSRASDFFPALRDYRLEIDSQNTFPHSAGIASSASSMAALSYCLADFSRAVGDNQYEQSQWQQKVSHIARLGSGSACRSVYAPFVSWGDESLEYASQVQSVHSDFLGWKDAILIVDSGEKSVSSRQGHALMNDHPYRQTRFSQARHNFEQIVKALKSGDTKTFCEITKKEAWELHALMMTATPPFCLMRPGTLAIIELLHQHGRNWNFPWTFTLDAGPNIHLLYPPAAHSQVAHFIESDLAGLLDQEAWIEDEMGKGPSPHEWIFERSV